MALKQAPRGTARLMATYFLQNGFQKSPSELNEDCIDFFYGKGRNV